ncbi:TRAP transporter small permease [Fluviibacterium sp. S390]|uniref:TRAP transporter small permease n=1 Tax=Fluviibacterium sp. S390 TaxID=3415139 RepID=UPI003C7BCD3D
MMLAAKVEQRIGRGLGWLAGAVALCGGAVLLGMASVVVISVVGRALGWAGLGPVTGDFELVEMGCAIAVFAFLPWCQMRRAHVTVDILSHALGPRPHAGLGCLGDLMLTLCSGVILWRLWLGFTEKFPHGTEAFRARLGMGQKPWFPETTYELQIPVWIPFGLALIGAGLFFAVCLYSVWRSLNWTLAGQEPGA